MSSFNTEEFEDILEKCKDQSNQAKQDEVSYRLSNKNKDIQTQTSRPIQKS